MATNPILLDIPEQFESERLLLRIPRRGDSQIIYPALRESLPTLRQWLLWAYELQSLRHSEAELREAIIRFHQRRTLRWLLFRQADGEFVGMAEFHSFNWSIPRCEIGYWARTSMTKQGYITEAVQRMTQFGFEVLHMARIDIHCDARNIASARVAEKAGYTLEGRLRHHRRDVKDELADTLIYAIVPEI